MKSFVFGLLAIVVACLVGTEAAAQDYWPANQTVPQQVVVPQRVVVSQAVVQQAVVPQQIVVERTVQREVLVPQLQEFVEKQTYVLQPQAVAVQQVWAAPQQVAVQRVRRRRVGIFARRRAFIRGVQPVTTGW